MTEASIMGTLPTLNAGAAITNASTTDTTLTELLTATINQTSAVNNGSTTSVFNTSTITTQNSLESTTGASISSLTQRITFVSNFVTEKVISTTQNYGTIPTTSSSTGQIITENNTPVISPVPTNHPMNNKTNVAVIILIVAVIVLIITLTSYGYCRYRKRKRQKGQSIYRLPIIEYSEDNLNVSPLSNGYGTYELDSNNDDFTSKIKGKLTMQSFFQKAHSVSA